MPHIIAAIQDEVTGFDPLYGGQEGKSANVIYEGVQSGFQTVFDFYTTSFAAAYTEHFTKLYAISPNPNLPPIPFDCFTPTMIASQYQVDRSILRAPIDIGPHDTAVYGIVVR